jgi:hypothetical protein
MFREVTGAKGILKNRQFKMFSGITLDQNDDSVKNSLDVFAAFTREVLGLLQIPVKVCVRPTGITREFYYFGSEGDYLSIPEFDPAHKIKCLSVAMAYHYGATEKLPVRLQNHLNTKERVHMTTYGLGIQRLFYTIFDSCRDALGFNLPKHVRPFALSIIPKRPSDMQIALRIRSFCDEHGFAALLDDRFRISAGRRAAFSDYIGAPIKVIVEGSTCSIKRRGHKQETSVSFDCESIHTLLPLLD